MPPYSSVLSISEVPPQCPTGPDSHSKHSSHSSPSQFFFSQSYQSFLSNMSWMSLCDELSHVHQALSWNGHILLPIFFLFPYCLELNSSEVSSKANFRSRSHPFECLLIIYTVLRILKILSSFWVIDMLFSTDYHTSFLRCSISTSKLC